MKIVIVGSYPYNPEIIDGGVEAVTVCLVDALGQIDDLDITIISAKKELKKEEIRKRKNIIIYYLPQSRHFGNITMGFMDSRRVRKKILELKPDIIHFQNPTHYAYIGFKPPCPVITTVHGIIYEEVKFTRGMSNWIRRMPRLYFEKLYLGKSRNIIAISPYVKEALRNLTTANMYLIPNPVDEKYFHIVNNELPDRILFVGFISVLKNALDLLKAIKILKKDIPFVELRIAAGVREEEYFKLLKSYVEKNELEKNVKFITDFGGDKILDEYRQCCVFATASLQEVFCMAVAQAMAAGVPVIAVKRGGLPYLIEDGKTGFLVDRGDINGLAEKLKLILNNKILRKELGVNAKRYALQQVKAELIAQKTYEVYKEVVQREKINDGL